MHGILLKAQILKTDVSPKSQQDTSLPTFPLFFVESRATSSFLLPSFTKKWIFNITIYKDAKKYSTGTGPNRLKFSDCAATTFAAITHKTEESPTRIAAICIYIQPPYASTFYTGPALK
jgi:hypothetical protein